jgi:hypothetical protein
MFRSRASGTIGKSARLALKENLHDAGQFVEVRNEIRIGFFSRGNGDRWIDDQRILRGEDSDNRQRGKSGSRRLFKTELAQFLSHMLAQCGSGDCGPHRHRGPAIESVRGLVAASMRGNGAAR